MSMKLALLATCAALAAGCGTDEGVNCTAVGCASAVSIDVTALHIRAESPVHYRLCVETRCHEGLGYVLHTDERHLALTVPRSDLPAHGSVTVTLHLEDAAGFQLGDAAGNGGVTINRPNGPDCPPECRRVQVTMAGNRLV